LHRLFAPHPDKPDREIASCNCLGDFRPFLDRPRKTRKPARPDKVIGAKESDE
jgi:hypothetical protein